jgi:hypothetical protein
MKTKKERESNSQKRQKVSKELAFWEQKVNNLETTPENKIDTDFVKSELKKCQVAMQKLNIGEERQRLWASGREFGHAHAKGN